MIAAPRGARRAAVALVCLLASTAGRGQEAQPFRTLNLSPTVAVFGLPVWTTAAAGTRVVASMDLANDYRFSSEGKDRIMLDGETWRGDVALEHGFGSRWTAGVEIPYFRQSGGMLDDVIDVWHSAFNLPDGGRNARPQDRLLFSLANASGEFLRLQSPADSLGDAVLSVGRSFGSSAARYFLRGALKLPTGDPDLLAGSGSTDVSLTLLRSRRLSLRRRAAGFFWGVGAARLGDAERIRYPQRHAIFTGLLGAAVRVLPRTGFEVQLDAHSALYRSPLKELGRAGVQVSLGAFRELERRRRLEFAVNEDLSVGTAPDVALHFAFGWNL